MVIVVVQASVGTPRWTTTLTGPTWGLRVPVPGPHDQYSCVLKQDCVEERALLAVRFVDSAKHA